MVCYIMHNNKAINFVSYVIGVYIIYSGGAFFCYTGWMCNQWDASMAVNHIYVIFNFSVSFK